MEGSAVTTTSDLRQVKLAMLRQLDTTLRQNYHQSLVEVLNELRMRSVVTQPDLSPEKVFSVILQAHVLSYKPSPSVYRLREALERITLGNYGLCLKCGRKISIHSLLGDPTLSLCVHCQGKVNG